MNSIDDIIKISANCDHPKQRLVALLPLLERRYTDLLMKKLESQCIDSSTLVQFAVAEESDYWRGLALEWLDDGFPVDAELALCLETLGQSKTGTQQHRHKAFTFAIKWNREHCRTTGFSGQNS